MAQVLPKVPHYAKPWQLLVSVCVTRMNTITAELSDIEKRYAAMQDEMEFEESVYNKHEFEKINLKKLTMEGEGGGLSGDNESSYQEASRKLADLEDSEEIWTKDLASIVTASRTTQCDNSGVRNSLNRKLDKILHCVVREKLLSPSHSSIYPYTTIEEGESLRNAADRLLHKYNLDENVIYFSNAPAGVLKINFEASEGELYRGAKMFFLKAHLHKLTDAPIADVEWLTLEELEECTHEGYFNRIKDIVS